MKNRHPKFVQKPQQPTQVDPLTVKQYLGQPKVQCANPDCGSELFVPCVQIHKISMLISKSGQQEYFSVQRSACLVCHALLPLQP
jgi:hypothetical protein